MTIITPRNMKFNGRDTCCFLLTVQLVTILLLLFFITLHASDELELTFCDISYTKGSKYGSNLNTVFNSLIQHTFETGFNASMDGQSPDTAYGLLQCFADATADQCKNCSQRATTIIRSICGNAVKGRILMDVCFLRYENYSFIGELDTSFTWYYNDKDASDPDDFKAHLKNLLTNLSVEAANVGAARKGYASGTTEDSFFPKIYGLVMCTRDISTNDCTYCLSRGNNLAYEQYYPPREGAKIMLGSCIVRYEIYSFSNGTKIDHSNTSNKKTIISNTSNKKTIIVAVSGGLLLAVLSVCVFAYIGRRLKSGVFRREYEAREEAEENTVINDDPQIVFTMEALAAATENFHDDNKLGEGGFGPVYKGITDDGKEIAVKKLSLTSMQGKKEFLNEVKLMTKIQHRNLVKLLGYCAEGLERLLVYEYLPNKSLDNILFDPNERSRLDWQKRYNIIVGVARGLLYLHEDSHLPIIHRDIKLSNILLDDKLNPKISDFGLARLFREDESHVITRVAGTYGYMAPEYAMQGQLSVKVDVYSFGVVLLEVVTGRKKADYNLSPEKQVLLGWAWRSYEEGNIEQMIDRAIMETCDVEEAMACINVGILCTQADSSLRPPMSTVILMLSSRSVTSPEPTKPPFMGIRKSRSSGSGFSHASASASHTRPVAPPSSTADASITDLVPR